MVKPIKVCEWVDKDLNETLKDTLRYKTNRMFGIREVRGEVAQGMPKFTRELIDSDPDPYRLLMRTPKDHSYDAVTIIMTGWMSRVKEDDEMEDEDDDEPVRFRVRVIATVNDNGVSVVVRQWDDEDNDELSTTFEDGGEGAFPDAFKAWWEMFKSGMVIDNPAFWHNS